MNFLTTVLIGLTLASPHCIKLNVDEDEQQFVRMATIISNNDLDFLTTLNEENGLWTPLRVHPMNKDGTRDFGLCGLNSAYHWDFINSENFKNPEKQLRYCYKLYKENPKQFYGYFRRMASYDKFLCKQ